MNIRMKDIAKDLGVSLITISKVLRNHPDIGDETRERVLARVKERTIVRTLLRVAWSPPARILWAWSFLICCIPSSRKWPGLSPKSCDKAATI
jgi:hypothetical protein